MSASARALRLADAPAIFAAVLALCGAAASAQTRPAPTDLPLPEVNNARLTELAAQIVLVHDVPGIAIAVIDKHGLYAFGAAGVRKAGEPDRVTPEDVFHLGSCGKVVSGVLLERLAESGKISLTEPLGTYLPKLIPGFVPHEGFARLTLQDLLRHRSGISDASDREQLAFLRVGARDPRASRRALLERMLGSAPTGRADRFEYTNANYLIAGAIAEAATDTAFEDLLQQQVFRPLEMTSVGFGAPTGYQPRGHRGSGGSAAPIEPGIYADNPAGMSPSGNAHMSLRDWARFSAVLMGGGKPGFLKPESLRDLLSPPADADGSDEKPTYAAGIVLSKTRGFATYTHAGSNTMWFCQMVLFPDKEWGILVATNIGGDPGLKAITDVVDELVALSR